MFPNKLPPPSSSQQEQATATPQTNSAAFPTPPSPSQEQREQKLSRNKQPPSPSPRSPSFREGQLFDPPANAHNTSETATPPSPQRGTSARSAREGDYLVQFTFAELLEAQRWADALKKDGGYVTSLNFIKKGDQVIHLRVGHFASTTEAGQFVDNFKAQGLQGIILKDPE